MAKKTDMTGPFLALIGSLVYLYLVYTWATAGFGAGGVFSGAGAFWFPIFAGLAAATTISMLLVALGGLAGWTNDMANKWAMNANFMAAVSLFALTASAGGNFWWVAIGLVLGQFGLGKMMM